MLEPIPEPMPSRLSERSLGGLRPGVAIPAYDRRLVRPGIVHIGVGAFHRAHQALAFDDCLAAGDPLWGIIAASLRRPDTRDALAPQDFLYTVSVAEPERRLRVIGALLDVLVAPERPERLLDRLSDPRTRIVSLTITEKGYMRAADGHLDVANTTVQHDLRSRGTPATAIGFLCAAIARRKAEGTPAFTILSCDNLPSNGATLKRLLLEFADAADPELAKYVADHLACPSTMVDRIVPATTLADRRAVENQLGAQDAWPVMTEPYLGWVIEDDFPAGRPEFVTPGVQLVRDVAPFETMKLRLLNGAHSTIAYAGLLLGHLTVAGAYADPAIQTLVARLWRETVATLPPGLDAAAYTEALAARFSNTALRHRLDQIATDGSQKLPQRILAPARASIGSGRPADALAVALACWIEAVRRATGGVAFGFADPRWDDLAEILIRETGDADAVCRMLGVLGLDTCAHDALPLVNAVAAAWRQIRAVGLRAAIAAIASEEEPTR